MPEGQGHVGSVQKLGATTFQAGRYGIGLVLVRRTVPRDPDRVEDRSKPRLRGIGTMSKWMTIAVILLVGYVLGVKFPQLAQRIGIA